MSDKYVVKVNQNPEIRVSESTTIVKKVVVGTPIKSVEQVLYDASTLGGDSAGFYRDYNNLTNKPTNIVLTGITDNVDSGGTIVNAAKALKNRGAKDVYVYITHGVLSGDAVKKIKNSVIKNLVITDTIDNVEKVKSVKNIEVLSISGLMSEAIKRISNSTSVSDLFK